MVLEATPSWHGPRGNVGEVTIELEGAEASWFLGPLGGFRMSPAVALEGDVFRVTGGPPSRVRSN